MNVGDFVENKLAPKWGIGKIIERKGENKLIIFFEMEGRKELIAGKARLEIVSDVKDHPLLDNIDTSANAKDFISYNRLENSFLRKFPQGFDDPSYMAEERDYKEAGRDLLNNSLSKGRLIYLIENENYEEAADAIIKVVKSTNLIHHFEQIALKNGMDSGHEQQKVFTTRLFSLLYGESSLQVRFEEFVEALEEINALKWTIATYFLFLRRPKEFPFIKPENQKKAAKAYSFDIMYKPRPNWESYERMIMFNTYVLGTLSKDSRLVPRDLIDVQGFIWCALEYL